MTIVEGLNNLGIAGLIMVIAGLVLLARAYLASWEAIVVAESKSQSGQNPGKVQVLCEQRFDVAWGIAFVVAGLAAQLLGGIFPAKGGGWILVWGLVAMLIWYAAYRSLACELKAYTVGGLPQSMPEKLIEVTPVETKLIEAKPVATMPVEMKRVEIKPVELKSADVKPVEAKSAEKIQTPVKQSGKPATVQKPAVTQGRKT